MSRSRTSCSTTSRRSSRAVGTFNDELIRAGVLLAAEGLDDPKESVVVDFTSETPVVTDGPYGETKELFRRLLHPRCGVEAGSCRMGEAGTAHGGQQDRDPPRDNDRRVPPGQRVDPEGTRVARADRAAVAPVVSTTEARGADDTGGLHPPHPLDGALARVYRRFLAGRGYRAGGARGGAHLLVLAAVLLREAAADGDLHA